MAPPPADSNNRIAIETAFRECGHAAPVPAVEIAADPNALMSLVKQVDLLTCVPQISLGTHVAAGAICALEVPGIRLPPVRISFVTLIGNDSTGAVQAVLRAPQLAAAESQGRGDYS